MTTERNTFAGMTDYTGVSLADILMHLRDWERDTSQAAAKLRAHSIRVEAEKERLQNSRAVLAFCAKFSELFDRYAADLKRLVSELPSGVRDAHVKIVRQLYDSAKHEDGSILRFRNDYVYGALKDESLRHFLEDIYTDAREVMVDFQDLSNLAPRLETFVGSEPPREVLTDFHLKPNVFGLGWNINRTLARINKWWRNR